MKLDTARPLRLSRHADLKQRAGEDILVLPEQAIRIRGSGGEILRLVMQGETGESIVAMLRARYPDSATLEDDVRQFLEQMLDNGGLVQVDPASLASPAHEPLVDG